MTDLAGNPHILLPDWDAPAQIGALVSLRTGGVSLPPYSSLNLGDHVGDEPAHVQLNRERLAQWAGLAPENLQWLRQVHGIEVVEAAPERGSREADAVTSRQPGVGCIVMTADCLPVFFCDASGQQVAVAHAGWRGLLNGVLEATLAKFENPSTVLAWLGPAIGPDSFEVGEEVRDAFLASDPNHASCFQPAWGQSGFGQPENLQEKQPQKWLADLYALARQRLNRHGLHQISGGTACTFREADKYFSYRRDGRTGRMASLIWIRR